MRLKNIAADTARVLSYLHSAASISIIHRYIKSSNILLDDNYHKGIRFRDFKVSFPRPRSIDHIGARDSGILGSEKSDVNSFEFC